MVSVSMSLRPAVALLLTLSLYPTVLLAQDTRTGSLEEQRAEKAKSLTPYKPGKLEKWMLWYEDIDPIAKIAPHDGFYLQYGFQWKPVGGGVGVGGGWRHDLFHRNTRLVLGAGISMRNYQMLMADFSLPYLLDNKLEVGSYVVYRHNPQEDFWGLGNDSLEDNRVSFLVDYTDFQGRVIARPVPWFEAGFRAGYMDGSIGSGTDSRFPSIEELFTNETAPGLTDEPDFNYIELSGAIDYRDQDDNARAGGFYGLTWREHSDIRVDRYSFRAVDLLLQQFVPIFDKKRVFAVQGRLQARATDEGQQVPFHFKPTLGGSTSHRGFNDFRFRDDSVVYVNAEYRWEAFSGLDMALFSDWGTVAPNIGQLKWSQLKNAYGIGFRFNTYKSVWFRVDLGFGGGEGIQYFFKFSKAF
jgi:outer membrane protein assembly factor BamA